MKSLMVELSEDQLKRLVRRASAQGFRDVSGYAQQVLAERLEEPEDGDEDYGTPESLEIRSVKDLEEKLLAGLDSGKATALDKTEWDRIRAAVKRNVSGGRRSKAS